MGKKILIVDDQPTIRRLIDISLQAADRQIFEAGSGEQAIAIARKETPDLIIMDLMMPGGMDGFQAIEQLREYPETSRCPVLVLTAKDQRTEKQRSFAAGADDYLAKPFKLETLLRKVDALLG